MTPTPRKRPCRFCTNPNSPVVQEGDKWYVECAICKARGPVMPNKTWAVTTWNGDGMPALRDSQGECK